MVESHRLRTNIVESECKVMLALVKDGSSLVMLVVMCMDMRSSGNGGNREQSSEESSGENHYG